MTTEREAHLLKAMHAAFMAMIAYRDSKDEETFQDAIDALGLACNSDKEEEEK